MKRILPIALALFVVLGMSYSAEAKKRYVFGGGPAGGTFQVVANAVQVYDPIKDNPDFSIKAQSSGGSTENLRTVNAGRVQFGTVYAGEVYLGRNGMMTGDPNKYDNIRVMGYLFGAPAQLVVRKGAGINTTKDLVGKKVGVGNAGSGAFANCERFFTHLGVWDKIERNAMGYDDAAQAFGNEQLDAFWLLTNAPAGAVMMAAQTNDIDLINVAADAEASGYFEKYPYFGKVTIPAGTYRGVDHDTPSFSDSALLVTNASVDADHVYELMKAIWSDAGLKHMVEQKKSFDVMSVKDGLLGVNPAATPLHPGAERFWKEMGVLK
ncbi:MAG: TAXI family TRAP transporter solute-binding subunit [Pseudodesulfovibrio sp.]|uniref:TRAP transporter solute receptor, TAXI family n=1 Tax=Pseudodesulfovibrio aespoeensis (strain ATCC 700646 / DSM 10631 / Aspo-2) TaxID=643562 RepID=E6VZB9_PSEA9|nr:MULTISPECIES: TAXI family TRAP transporter solute-binding subunit [Pseudodesulfovibrio]MBU4190835.1 TAXI family TRAP transporter solute-binding subunit [Pseudomonadota bacterium]ADU63991.1 TRAP transporter solute receptor, TAXI family [Pseudodesulfovibrio aespoeensis Aspo-2]MBU4243864.1 TAXI family TRAP transporter solute-binding subunit [Pseudomonadota bacterium]MBU4377509.1 TAXI family TRAP transporter solute-binding subunit [Pseudomonadota bacterium]MBU4475396.1 TAXI family TRAP transpor